MITSVGSAKTLSAALISSGIHGRMVKNDAGNLSALDLAVGVLWQLVQHPHEVRQLEWSNAARERGGQARRVYRRAGDVFPQHNRRPDPIADLIVWNGKDTSFLESRPRIAFSSSRGAISTPLLLKQSSARPTM